MSGKEVLGDETIAKASIDRLVHAAILFTSTVGFAECEG